MAVPPRTHGASLRAVAWATRREAVFMERCDFASITRILRDNLLDGNFDNQMEFAEALFASYLEENEVYFDMGLLNKWLNGLARLSPAIGRFYSESRKNRKALVITLQDAILPCLADSAMVAQEIHALLIGDFSVSERKKEELCAGYPCKNDSGEAEFIAGVLIFGMVRPFQPHDVRKPNLLTGGLSPVLRDFVFDEGLPKPCKFFCGRDRELERLHDTLVANGKVFLHGIPGIGKSELAKAYAKLHKKDYTNFLYLTYSGSLKRDIAGLDFADDLESDDEDERFRKHNRFLRTLKEDTLLIIDNFNATSTQDEILSIVLKYRCRVLFTTRSSLPGQTCFLLEEIQDREALFQLMAMFYTHAEKHRAVLEEIMEVLHRHTLAIELAARLLETGMLKPKAVLEKLIEEKASFDASDKISMSKDGKSQRATYYDHIHTLFSMFRLSMPQREIMRNLTLIPLTGIPARLFGEWLQLHNLNNINDMVEMGFVQSTMGNHISLHPMVQEVAISDFPPSVRDCRVMLESIRATCQLHGLNVSYYKVMFQTAENVILFAGHNDTAYFLLFLEDVFQYMQNYHYTKGMELIVSVLSAMLSDESVGTAMDRALLLDCRASLEKSPERAIKLIKEALEQLPEINEQNALLVSNLNANIGGRYRMTRKYHLAKQYMEAGVEILRKYNLIGYHDSMIQALNYAVLLNDIGDPEHGLVGLYHLESQFREMDTMSSDFATLQQTLGALNINAGHPDKGVEHLRKALAIFTELYADEEELLAEKQEEIRDILAAVGLPLSYIQALP